jgi:hypothetical protein
MQQKAAESSEVQEKRSDYYSGDNRAAQYHHLTS